MIAEIYHKISSNASNLTDRLEDNLTGNFFGTMRYISFNSGLKRILADCIYPNELASKILSIDYEYWDEHITFWPYDSDGEIDILIDFPDLIIGIEVKYLSGLSTDDDICNEMVAVDTTEQLRVESRQQLARESRILSNKGMKKDKILIFIADEASGISVYQNTISRNIIAESVHLAVISWQDILIALKQNCYGNKFEQLIIKDLQTLLIGKGFERFSCFGLGKELTIDQSLFYRFESLPFSFSISEFEVGEGLYYEFK